MIKHEMHYRVIQKLKFKLDGGHLYNAPSILPMQTNKTCVKPVKQFRIFIGMFGFLIFPANPAWAVQAHGGVEGLVSHQIGHVLFVIGMGYLLYRLSRLQRKDLDWLEFKIFLWLIIAWNLLTFSGHWMHEFVAPEKFIKTGGNIIAFSITNFSDAYFYLTRLDHLLLVPSFIFLLLALRKWRLQQ